MQRTTRRKLRTAILGVVAFVALIWGAIDIVGVPPENLFGALGQLAIGVLVVIALALLPASLLVWQKKRRRDKQPPMH